MNAADHIRLRHMLDAAREGGSNQVSAEFRKSASEIPWPRIIGMRNRLIHGYSDVNTDVVWSTIISDLPDLVAKLENLIAREG